MIGGVDLSKGKIEKYQVTFNLTPEEATLVVKDLKGNIVQPKEKNIYMLETGIYTYTASSEGYTSEKDIRIEIYQETTIKVELFNPGIVSFTTATDEQLERMLNAHYNGEIDIANYWHIGDTRTIHIDGIYDKDSVATISEQNMTFVIIGINHDNLVEKIGTRSKAAITLQTKEILGDNGVSNVGRYYFAGSSPFAYVNDVWSNSGTRIGMNLAFVSALPISISKLIKPVIKKNLNAHTRKNNRRNY